MNNSYRLIADNFYTTREASEVLKVSPDTMRRIIRQGRIKANRNNKPFKIYGQHILEFIDKEFITRGSAN